MVGDFQDNNVVTILGVVATELRFSHEMYGEGFYSFLLDVPRLSDSHDYIGVTISERLICKRAPKKGDGLSVDGQFRSYNTADESRSKLILTVFAREIAYWDGLPVTKNPNAIYLNGYICKKPIYRSTPFGREISDLLVAVNRAYGKSDYIPCISWGRNARFCSNLEVGDNIKVWGRVQSRAYQKKTLDGSVVEKVAYEVSVSKLEAMTPDRLTQLPRDANLAEREAPADSTACETPPCASNDSNADGGVGDVNPQEPGEIAAAN